MASIADFNLTPKLKKMVDLLRKAEDNLKYQELMFLASKVPVMDPSLQVPENKVVGCLSKVYVHATLDKKNKVQLQGDSDSQLTKGLVTLLVNGLSGYSIEEVLRVKPEFIVYSGITKSLTPGRNNGFLNMFNLIQFKTKLLGQSIEISNNAVIETNTSPEATPSTTSIITTTAATTPPTIMATAGSSNNSIGPVESSIRRKLQILQPVALNIENESHLHAGHHHNQHLTATATGTGIAESHFKVEIVSPLFDKIPLVKRHGMVHELLAEELRSSVHALSLSTKTPQEVLDISPPEIEEAMVVVKPKPTPRKSRKAKAEQ